MSGELFDELRLSRALRLDPGEGVRLDAAALAAAAAAAEQVRLVRWVLGALAVALSLPAIAFSRVVQAVVWDPSLALDPFALAGLAAVPILDQLRVLGQPATALAILAAVAIFTVSEGREKVHAHATRT